MLRQGLLRIAWGKDFSPTAAKRTRELEKRDFRMRLPEREILRELERRFRDLVYLEDEEGYWKWISEQPGFDPNDEKRRRLAADAWREALSARQRGRRRT
jgi:hypothetical protein